MVATTTRTLTPYQVQRYSRHIIMPQVGSGGQRKMLDARVLIIGAGGLGSPVSIYLTLAGVGTIGIVDFDTVDITNLQRQILHQNDDIGRSKAESARETTPMSTTPQGRDYARGAADLRQRYENHGRLRHHRERRRQLPGALPG